MKKMNILGIGQGCLVPSYRYRLQETRQDFSDHQINLILECFHTSSYPPKNFIKRFPWLFMALIDRLSFLLLQKKADIIILQREMISTLYTLERFISKPYILDVDDAIHLNQKFHAINKIAQKAHAVVVCNQFLADYYKDYNKNIFIIPTPVNTEKYKPGKKTKKSKTITIGWIGTSSNFKSLKLIENALATVLAKNPHIVLKVVSNQDPAFSHLNSKQYIYKQWSDQEDVQDIQSFDIGIMPLEDSDHSRGKCAFKMLQYMACGIPLVSTCLPMNQQILNIKLAGFCVNGYDLEWVNALELLIQNQNLRIEYGMNGRKVIEEHYSTKIFVKKYSDIFHFIQKGQS
jgi:glycosyltransferase involved in cell wall biosynthesis